MSSDNSCSAQPFKLIAVIVLLVNWHEIAAVHYLLPWLLLALAL